MRFSISGTAAFTCALALVTTDASADSAAEAPVLAAPPLTFGVEPSRDEGETWKLKIENTGDVPVRLVADPSLLILELSPPTAASAKRAPAEVVCALPTDARAANDSDAVLVVPPRRSWSVVFDPTFYCFGKRERAALVKGTVVKPRFGWLPSGTAKKPVAPFVAGPTSEGGTRIAQAKTLEGRPFVLGESDASNGTSHDAPDASKADASKADASKADAPKDASKTDAPKSADAKPGDVAAPEGPTSKPSEPTRAPLALTLPATLDASFGKDLSTTVTLANGGEASVTTFFRSNAIGFRVQGPGGTTTVCGTPRAVASPIPELFTTLKPRGRTSLAVLFTTVCPPETFARPGIHRVFAVLDTTQASGRSIGVRTWDGKIESAAPLVVRVRRTKDASAIPAPKLDP